MWNRNQNSKITTPILRINVRVLCIIIFLPAELGDSSGKKKINFFTYGNN